MKFPKERYRFIHVPEVGKTVAVSSYAGKPVSGYAKCDPKDTYDKEAGEELAAARCNVKVAKKRLSRAKKELAAAQEEMIRAISKFNKMSSYNDDASRRLYQAKLELIEIEDKLA